jgi:ATP-binding cassette subfamily B protein
MSEESGTRRVVKQALRPERAFLVGACLTIVLSAAAVLAGPGLVGYAVDHLSGRPVAQELHVLGIVAACYLAAALIGAVCQRQAIRWVGEIGERFLYRLRVRVFEHLQLLPLGFYDSERTGRLVTRMTSDFDAMESLVQQGLIILVMNALLFFSALVILAVLSWQLFAVCLLVVPILYRSTRRFQRDSHEAYTTVRERVGQTLVSVQEGISGVRVVQAFGREDHQVRHFASRNRAQLDANIDAVRVSTRFFPVVEGTSVVTTAGMIGVGGLFVHDHIAPLGTVVAFILYLSSLFDPIQQMSQLLNQLQQSGAALRKVLGLLDTAPTVVEGPSRLELPAASVLELAGVSFAYAGPAPELVLHHVDLVLQPGERLALVGPTGAGKSTLAKVIARLYDPVAGTVAYGGVDLREASFESLRRRIVMVPQEGFLFEGSLIDNVRLARPEASDEEAVAALAAVGAAERFERLPGGLSGSGHGSLSAGERQLVALARAALANPDVLVLDEATSSLDPGTEAAVEAAMEAVTRGRTTIVIAHRLSTARTADRIAVVAAGGIAELGSHDELVALGGRYASMWAAWESDGSQAAA